MAISVSLKEKMWAFKTTNSVSSERKKRGHFKRNLWQLLKAKTFFHFQDTNTKCRHESIHFSIARIPIQNPDMNQFVFPLPEYQYKMKT
jgi:hypothetical protein